MPISGQIRDKSLAAAGHKAQFQTETKIKLSKKPYFIYNPFHESCDTRLLPFHLRNRQERHLLNG